MIFLSGSILFFLVIFTGMLKMNRTAELVLSATLLVLELVTFWIATEKLNFAYSDLIVYYSDYIQSITLKWGEFLQNHQFEFFYDTLVWLLAKLSLFTGAVLSRHDFVMFINFIKIVIMFLGLRQIKSGFFSAMVASIYLWYQYSNLFSYNLLRQGLALGILAVIIVSFSKEQKPGKFILALILVCFLHKSMIYLGLLSGLIVLMIKKGFFKREWLYIGSVLGAFLYVTGLNGVLLSKLPFNLIQLYQSSLVQTMAAGIGSGTNDIKYLLLSIAFLIATYVLFRKNKSDTLTGLIHDYIFTISIVYLFMGFIPFSFRIAMSGWFLFPITLFNFIDEKFKNTTFWYVLLVLFLVLEGWAASPFTVLGG